MTEDPRFLYQVERVDPMTFAGVVYERISMDKDSNGYTQLVVRATAVSISEKKVRQLLKQKLRKKGLSE